VSCKTFVKLELRPDTFLSRTVAERTHPYSLLQLSRVNKFFHQTLTSRERSKAVWRRAFNSLEDFPKVESDELYGPNLVTVLYEDICQLCHEVGATEVGYAWRIRWHERVRSSTLSSTQFIPLNQVARTYIALVVPGQVSPDSFFLRITIAYRRNPTCIARWILHGARMSTKIPVLRHDTLDIVVCCPREPQPHQRGNSRTWDSLFLIKEARDVNLELLEHIRANEDEDLAARSFFDARIGRVQAMERVSFARFIYLDFSLLVTLTLQFIINGLFSQDGIALENWFAKLCESI